MPPFLILVVAFWAVVLGGAFYAVARFLRLLERRADSAAELAALRERVASLEDALDDVRGSVERLEAGQEFTTRLLGERRDPDEPAT